MATVLLERIEVEVIPVGFLLEYEGRELGAVKAADFARDLEMSVATKDAVVNYLERGQCLAAVGGFALDDVLVPGQSTGSTEDVLTDGEFVWPRYFAYFVRNHQFAVPEALVERALERVTPVAMSDEEVRRLVAEYRELLEGS